MKWMLTSYFLLTSEVTTTSFTLLFLSIRYFRTILHYPAAKTSWVALCNHGYCDRSQKDKKRKANKNSKAKKCLKVSNWHGYVRGFGHSLASQTWVCLEPELASLIHCLESPSLFLHIQCPHFLYFLLFPIRYKFLGTTYI